MSASEWFDVFDIRLLHEVSSHHGCWGHTDSHLTLRQFQTTIESGTHPTHQTVCLVRIRKDPADGFSSFVHCRKYARIVRCCARLNRHWLGPIRRRLPPIVFLDIIPVVGQPPHSNHVGILYEGCVAGRGWVVMATEWLNGWLVCWLAGWLYPLAGLSGRASKKQSGISIKQKNMEIYGNNQHAINYNGCCFEKLIFMKILHKINTSVKKSICCNAFSWKACFLTKTIVIYSVLAVFNFHRCSLLLFCCPTPTHPPPAGSRYPQTKKTWKSMETTKAL